MQIFDWLACVARFVPSWSEALAKERGLDPITFERLRERRLIGIYRAQKWNTDTIAFPVCDPDGTPFRAQCRGPALGPDGKRPWDYEPFDDPRPIYPLRFGSLLEAERIYLFESQWDAVALIAVLNLWEELDRGQAALISTRGAQYAKHLRFLSWPKEALVYAFPQSDKAGKDWLEAVLSVTGGCYVAEIPQGLGGIKDLNDWVRDAHATACDIEGVIDHSLFRELKKETPEKPEKPTPLIYRVIDPEDSVDEDQEPVPDFPLDALPDKFRRPVEEVMRHYRVPALLPSTCALVINSVALGRGVVTRSNVRRTYANLYAIIGAQSGSGKTPPFDEFMAPLMKLQKESLEAFRTNQKPRAEAELKLLERKIQVLVKQGENPRKFDIAEDCRHEKLAELLQQKAVLEDSLQYSARLWTEDFTSEALGILLANNREQMAVLTDDGGLVIYNLLGRYTDGDVKDDILLCKAKTVSAVPVDRVGRESILLHQPCVAMLVLTQPDLLHKLFSNERLLVGGFLARCLAVDSQMQIQDETEESQPECDPLIMAQWSNHIESLVKMFRFAEEPYWIDVDPEVRKLSRHYYNMWAEKARGMLSDVSSFAVRWCERAWEIFINLHMGIYGVEWVDRPARLSKETFENAIRISDFFAERQLEVLHRPRIEAQKKVRTRLEEVLEANHKNPMTIRTLRDRHGIKKEEVISTVKSHPEIFGMAEVKPPRGSKSTLVFFWSSPPSGIRGKK